MTIFHMNAILGEPEAAKNSFSGSSPTRLFDPDNEVGAGSWDKEERANPCEATPSERVPQAFESRVLASDWPIGSTQLCRPSNFIGCSIASSSIVLDQGSIVTVICREKKTGLFYRPFYSLLGLFIVFSPDPARGLIRAV